MSSLNHHHSYPKRATIGETVSIKGTGIHSGAPCEVRLAPAKSGFGIQFQRPGKPSVPAVWYHSSPELCDRRTVIIGDNAQQFEQIEHLMAALYAFGITDLLVEQSGPEVPFLDGGSSTFCQFLRNAGKHEYPEAIEPLVIESPIAFRYDDSIITATPDETFRLTAFVEFPNTIVDSAGFTLRIDFDQFEKEIAPARTFIPEQMVEAARAAGMGKGANLTNTVVFNQEMYLNPSLNFEDEVPRHKVLDLLGDLALIARPVKGHFWAWKAGHKSHTAFVHHLAKTYGVTP